MKNRCSSTPPLLVCLLSLGLGLLTPAFVSGQTAPPAKTDASREEPMVLSPFVVSTEKDTGYRATNSISGTRLDAPIKDTPMPIEVITRQFLDDTGTTDLRSALKYSSGIVLQSQNDLSNRGAGAYQGPGGVNNPEGATANPNAVQVKLRGFVTDNALRDGFIRQNSTDSVNVERVEVVRGPAALLYGTGNFGGVVNYLTKRPSNNQSGSLDIGYGMNHFMRGQVDVTGPIDAGKKLAYRVTGAAQTTEDVTDYFKEKHYFVSPALSWKAAPRTEVYLDYEYGEQDTSGIGARRLRSVAGQAVGGVGLNNDQNEHGGLYTPPGADPRAYRVTGPDTYLNSQAANLEFKVTQQLTDNLYLLAGYNYSKFDYQNRDVNAQLFVNDGPVALRQTIQLSPLSPVGDSSISFLTGTVPGSIVKYNWSQREQAVDRRQERVELTDRFTLFEGHSKWLRFSSQILAGYSELRNDINTHNHSTVPGAFSYKAPLDLTPLVFGKQGDGSADPAMYQNNIHGDTAWNRAFYLSYVGSFLDDRLTILVGGRKDTNDAANTDINWANPGAAPTTSSLRGNGQSQKTYQQGLSVKVTKNISLYALRSEGLQPNFSGRVLADTGAPAGASLAKSKEFGLKFDLLDGRISGTISRFTITKTGYTNADWWNPVTLGKPRFDGTKDVVFNVSNFTPTSAGSGGSNGGGSYKTTGLPTLDQPAVVTAWNAAVAAGAAFRDGAGTWHLDATKPTGATYMDTAFATIDGDNGANWPGFLYQGLDGSDPLVNNATMDTSAFHGSGSGNAAYLTSQESKGYDMQIQIKATANLDIVLNGAITEVKTISYGTWMTYPFLQDRWAVWNFNNGSWGTFGLPRNTIYGTPGTATSGPATETRLTSVGNASGDDTPKYRFDIWGNYRVTTGALKGLSLGLGGFWQSKREYASGVTHGSGQLIIGSDGKLVILYTKPQYNVDAMAKYEWQGAGRHQQYVQLNVTNLLDDQREYGLIYNPPLSAKLTYGIHF